MKYILQNILISISAFMSPIDHLNDFNYWTNSCVLLHWNEFEQSRNSYHNNKKYEVCNKLIHKIIDSLIIKYKIDLLDKNTQIHKLSDYQILDVTSPVDPDEPVHMESMVSIDFNKRLSFSQNNTGYLHNIIIKNVLNDNKDAVKGEISVYAFGTLVQEESMKYGYSLSASESDNIISKLEDTYPSVVPIDMIAYYKQKIPESSIELNFLEDYLNYACGIEDDNLLEEYTNGYLDIIAQSGLSESEMNKLMSAITVAANSAVLWK